MQLLSVNVSPPKTIEFHGGSVQTGIFKEPVTGRVPLGKLNLRGDGQADLSVHGGLEKAVYAYPFEHYDYWKRELNPDDFGMGQFGENFTVEGMLEDEVSIGDVFRVGTATIEVSQPRVPCFKLAIKMGMPQFPKLFLKSGRVGFYARVLEEGDVGQGDTFEQIRTGVPRMSVRDVCHLLYFDTENIERMKQALKMEALAKSWQQSFQDRLRKASSDWWV